MKKGLSIFLAALIAVSFTVQGRDSLVAQDAGSPAISGETKSTDTGKKAPGGERKKEERKNGDGPRGEVRDLVPAVREDVSMPAVLLLDLAVPGGGHFYLGNEYAGYSFLALKVLGAYSIFYCYRDWQYRRSLYRAARRANGQIDPDHALEFEDPNGGYNTVEEFRRDYDRAAQRITFSVLANVAVYAVSLMMTCQAVKKINTESLPTFELQYSCATMGQYEEIAMTLAVSSRF